jgi:glycosyltransferase involved in cell wall biosynthesis
VELSIVIPSRNAGAKLGRQLRALLGQNGLSDAWEIIVADNGSTDDTVEHISSFSGWTIPIRHVDAGAEPGINRARNRGVLASRGRFVLICDADDIVEDGWLRSMWTALADGADLVGGYLRLLPRSGRETDEAVVSAPSSRFMRSPIGANCGFRRVVFDELGGFDEAFAGGGDDKDFFWRAQLRGYELKLVPSAIVRYTQRSSARGVFRQRFYYGAAYPQLYAKFKDAGMPRSSIRGALRPWIRLPLHVLRIVRGGDARYASAVSLGLAAGRLLGSWRHKVWYP